MKSRIDRREFLIASGATAGLAAVGTSRVHAKALRVRVLGLQVDYLDCPLGLESRRPRLSWQLESDARNVQQSAYRILVSSSEKALRAGQGDLWDSGKICSRKSIGIQYGGRPLASRERCWWSVQIWDERGEPSAPSAASWWEMGLLDPKEWSAQWLSVENAIAKADREAGLHWIWGARTQEKTTRQFRFKFQLPTASLGGELFAVTNDRVMWTQIGRVWLNGEPIAGRGGWSDDYDEIGLMESDTMLLALKPLRAGEHLLAVEVHTTDLKPPMTESTLVHGLAVFSRFNLDTGETLRLGTGSNWKTRLAQVDEWQGPDYDDSAWEAAQFAPIEHQPWPPQPAMHLRRTFILDQQVRSARLYATALGAYEGRLNGHRVGGAHLTPEISQYARRVLYQVFDVTKMLRRGPNVLGFTVGDGWYASFDDRYAWGLPPRRVLGQLELTLADGSKHVVGTDSAWRTAESPIRESQMQIGEIYDARLEQPGWDTPRFDALHWKEAQVAETPPGGLVAQTSPPIRVTETLAPQSISQPKPGVYVFKFTQNFAGWCRLKVKGARGTRVELEFGEWLNTLGEVAQTYGDSGTHKRDIYILRGDTSGETFEPHFTYCGIRYVQVSGLPSAPTLESLKGIVAHTDLKITGQLRTASPLIDQIWRNTVWTRRSNFVSIPTDATRREQRGYTASAGLCWDDAAFNMDVASFTSRVMDNIVDEQAADGAFPMKAPTPRSNGSADHLPGSPPGWGDAGIILPWTAWQRYGDLALIERNWEPMNRYLQFILNHNPEYLWKNKRGRDFGEWLSLDFLKPAFSALPATSKDLIATAYWAHSADLLSQMAGAIGRKDDEERLRTVFDRVRRAFQNTFVKDDGTVGSGSQTSYVLALKFGLLPEGIRQAAAQRLAADVRARGVSLTTGILGTQFILDVLADTGFCDLAYGLLLRTEFPSWGYAIRRGATTVWETWWAGQPEEQKQGGQGAIMTSEQNHSDLATISGFLFRRIAGIDLGMPGFESIVIRPALDPRLKKGGGDYDSIMGRISTDWSQNGDGRFLLDVRIPANTSARIHLPAAPFARVQEGRLDISGRKDVHWVSRSGDEAVLEVGSGLYRFTVQPIQAG